MMFFEDLKCAKKLAHAPIPHRQSLDSSKNRFSSKSRVASNITFFPANLAVWVVRELFYNFFGAFKMSEDVGPGSYTSPLEPKAPPKLLNLEIQRSFKHSFFSQQI